jgi:hypothetical protein
MMATRSSVRPPLKSVLLDRAAHTGDGSWHRRQTRGVNGVPTYPADAVLPILDTLEGAADLLHFPTTHLIEALEHFVVL